MGEGLNPAAVSTAVSVVHLARVKSLRSRGGHGVHEGAGKGCEDIPAVV